MPKGKKNKGKFGKCCVFSFLFVLNVWLVQLLMTREHLEFPNYEITRRPCSVDFPRHNDLATYYSYIAVPEANTLELYAVYWCQKALPDD